MLPVLQLQLNGTFLALLSPSRYSPYSFAFSLTTTKPAATKLVPCLKHNHGADDDDNDDDDSLCNNIITFVILHETVSPSI